VSFQRPFRDRTPSGTHLGLAILIVAPALAAAIVGGSFLVARQLSGEPNVMTLSSGSAGPGAAAASETTAIDQIASQVASLRGLSWLHPPKVEVVLQPELVSHYRQASASEWDPVRLSRQGAMLKLLHLIPAEADYAQTLQGATEADVRGFYDSEAKAIFVGATGTGELGPETRMALAHELDHALTDQHFDFGRRQDALDRADAQDELLALDSLVEGDAVLLQNRWMAKYMTDAEQVLALFGAPASSESSGAVLPFLDDQSMFPYTAGLRFVERLSNLHGTSGIDRAYRDPPRSTEEIFRPDLYLKGLRGGSTPAPILPRPAGCTTIRSGTLGRFLMGELLQQTPQAQGALDGWNGDAFAVFACPDGLAMVELWQADSEDDASALATALSSSWSRAWSGASAAPSSVGRFTGRSGAGIIAVRAGEVTLDLAQTPLALDELGP